MNNKASKCLDCGVPFCNNSCPLGNLIPDINYLVANNHWQKALELLESTNNFPEFTGRLCPGLCEKSCILNNTQDPIPNKSIELAIIEKGFSENWVKPLIPSMHTGYKIAIIGSGPSGLAAAQQLIRQGHLVTVFEGSKHLGGVLHLKIPDSKLEKWVIKRRINQLKQEGINFVTNTWIGINISIEAIKEKFDIICIAAGKIHKEKSILIDRFELETDNKNKIITDNNNMTNIKGIFACGDVRTGQSIVCKSIYDGRQTAKFIDLYLNR